MILTHDAALRQPPTPCASSLKVAPMSQGQAARPTMAAEKGRKYGEGQM